MAPLLVPSVAVTVMSQESGGVGKGMARNSLPVGVIAVLPPTFLWVSPLSVHSAIQFTETSWLAPLVMATVYQILAGLPIVLSTVQWAFTVDVLAALQKPAVLALAAVAPTVMAPAARNPVKAAQIAARRDLCIINCLSAFALSPLAQLQDARASALVYTRLTGRVWKTAIYARLDESERRKAF